MKIKVFSQDTKKPLTNTEIQVQIKGSDSGSFTFTTDGSGAFELADKFQGQQLAAGLTGSSTTGFNWVVARDGAELTVSTSKSPIRENL